MEEKYPREGTRVRVSTGQSGTATPEAQVEEPKHTPMSLPRRDSQGHIAVDHSPYPDPPPSYETVVAHQPTIAVAPLLSQTTNGMHLEFFLALSTEVQNVSGLSC